MPHTEKMKAGTLQFLKSSILPRVLVDVSKIDMSTSILGYKTSAPIMIAPTGLHGLAHPEGEVATARAAVECNTIMALSFSSSCNLEEVATSCNAIRFFQLYVYRRRDVSALMFQRAERNGFKAIIVTANTPRLGRREADIKNKMISPSMKNLEGLISTDVGSVIGLANILEIPIHWDAMEWFALCSTSLVVLANSVQKKDEP